MDFYMLNNFGNDEEQPKKKLNKKKVIKVSLILLFIITIVTIVILYINNFKVRNFFDIYIFRKEVYENNLNYIPLNEEDNNYSYAYDKYIAVLNKNDLNIYNSSGKKEHSLNIEITMPIFNSKEKHLVIADKDGHNLYSILGGNIIWQKSIDGNIKNITVNKNGYVSVIANNTSYKSLIITFDSKGNQLFTVYLASTDAIDVSISQDNTHLAIAEINYSGTVIQSNVEIITIEGNKEFNYKAEVGKMITNVEYQEKNKLVCMYDDSIEIIENNNSTEFLKYDSKNILFLDINLLNNVAQIEKKGILNSEIKFTNIIKNTSSIYEIDGIPKIINSSKEITAINLGSEVLFIKTNGWLKKKYKSTQEVQKVILGNSVAGIVYKNKIEIIKL